ncbi:GMC oxidoreductase, partial [Burkholderia pseudomallei]
HAFTASDCHLPPTSRGSVHAASPDPARAPSIAPNDLSTDYDRHVAANALRLTRRLASAPALARYAPEELLPGARFVREA